MLRCIYCGLCEEACPKDAIYLTDRIVPSEFTREGFVYGKDILVEKVDERIDITKRKKKSFN
jgi:NADH-quinone oxidoreductase subunit I